MHDDDPLDPIEERELIKALGALRALGPTSAAWLVRAGIRSVDEFMASDPVELFERVEDASAGPVSLNMLKSIVAAQRNISWQAVKAERIELPDGDEEIRWQLADGAETHEAQPLAKQLQALPNIGPTMAAHLIAGGVTSIDDFLSRNPAELLIAIDRAYLSQTSPSAKRVRMTLPHLKAICGAQQRVPWNDAVVDDKFRDAFKSYKKRNDSQRDT